jgi:RHS repeat-associated protein
VAPAGLDPLYDMSARFYSPASGTFSQLDSYLGGAQNPLSMNRFLYAHANPATLIDPTGHGVEVAAAIRVTNFRSLREPHCDGKVSECHGKISSNALRGTTATSRALLQLGRV